MTDQNKQPYDYEQLRTEAADWVVCLVLGDATDHDAARLAVWRATSPAHEAAFREVAGLRHYAEVARKTKDPAIATRRLVLGGGTGLALAAVTFGMAKPPLGLWPSLAELTADHSTAVGERYTFTPAAGVTVEMSSRTAVSLNDGDKGIKLVTGEAFLTLSELAEAFHVKAGKLRASARSAQFNVQVLPGGVRLACVAGQVECGGDRPILLKANEQVILASNGDIQRSETDAQKSTAWRRGQLIFEGTPLSEVVDQVNLYHSGRIVLANASLGKLPVYAVFHISRIEDAVPQIEQFLNLRARRLAGGVVLIG